MAASGKNFENAVAAAQKLKDESSATRGLSDVARASPQVDLNTTLLQDALAREQEQATRKAVKALHR